MPTVCITHNAYINTCLHLCGAGRTRRVVSRKAAHMYVKCKGASRGHTCNSYNQLVDGIGDRCTFECLA